MNRISRRRFLGSAMAAAGAGVAFPRLAAAHGPIRTLSIDTRTIDVAGRAARVLGITDNEKWLFYLTYYYAQGMYQRGGKYAEEGRRVVADVLLPLQGRDGSWEGKGGEERGGGKVYATAMAVLSLVVKNHFLPIYQR